MQSWWSTLRDSQVAIERTLVYSSLTLGVWLLPYIDLCAWCKKQSEWSSNHILALHDHAYNGNTRYDIWTRLHYNPKGNFTIHRECQIFPHKQIHHDVFIFLRSYMNIFLRLRFANAINSYNVTMYPGPFEQAWTTFDYKTTNNMIKEF